MSPTGALPGLSPGILLLLRYGAPATLSVVLPFLGIVIGGAALSLLLNVSGRAHGDPRALRLSRDLMEAVMIRPGVVFLAGLLPLPFVALAQRLFAPSAPLSWGAWVPAFAALLSGCALLSVYRRAILRSTDLRRGERLAGTAGLLALLAGSCLLIVLLGTLSDPSKMPLVRRNLVYFLSWNSVVDILLFLALSSGLTGGVILLAIDRPRKAKGEPDPAYREYVRSVGAPFARAVTLVVPVLVLLNLISIPSTALSARVFAAAAAILLLAPAVFLLLSPPAGNRPERRGAPVTILYVLMFFAMVAGWRAEAGSASLGHSLPFLVPEAAVPVSEGRIAAIRAPTEATLKSGKEVFETICTPCHRFDTELIGPPLDEVVPRYRGDVERLKDFVRYPVKVNAGYPSMPRVGVTERQLDAVAHYLLNRLEKPESDEGHAEAKEAAEEGERVYEEACRPCHLFDKRLVGPPLDEAVPKYRGDVERLKGFIREPVKVNPEYPPMPVLSLGETKVDAVARYLLGRSGEPGDVGNGNGKQNGHGSGN